MRPIGLLGEPGRQQAPLAPASPSAVTVRLVVWLAPAARLHAVRVERVAGTIHAGRSGGDGLPEPAEAAARGSHARPRVGDRLRLAGWSSSCFHRPPAPAMAEGHRE